MNDELIPPWIRDLERSRNEAVMAAQVSQLQRRVNTMVLATKALPFWEELKHEFALAIDAANERLNIQAIFTDASQDRLPDDHVYYLRVGHSTAPLYLRYQPSSHSIHLYTGTKDTEHWQLSATENDSVVCRTSMGHGLTAKQFVARFLQPLIRPLIT